MRDQAEAFANVAAYFGGARPVSGGADPVRVPTYNVSESFFDVMGVTPQLGGTFVPEVVSATGPVNAVVSDGFWRSYFGADPDILGAQLSISGRQATVVGRHAARVRLSPGRRHVAAHGYISELRAQSYRSQRAGRGPAAETGWRWKPVRRR